MTVATITKTLAIEPGRKVRNRLSGIEGLGTCLL